MGQRHEDYHDLPPSEALRVGRSNRVQAAEELAWKTLLTYGDPQNGYRFPLGETAETICRRLGVSSDSALKYLKELSTRDPLDPFEREPVTVHGNTTLFLRPRHESALKAHLRAMRKGGGNA